MICLNGLLGVSIFLPRVPSSFLQSLSGVDGFILKGRSPTSAIRDAKFYSGPNPGAALRGKGPGFFGKAVLERFSHLAIEDEGRLRNPNPTIFFLSLLKIIKEDISIMQRTHRGDLSVFQMF